MRNESNTGRPTIGTSRPGFEPEGPSNQRKSNSIWLAAAAVLSALILALVGLNIKKYYGGTEAEATKESQPASPQATDSAPPESIEPIQGTAQDQFPDSSQLQALVSGDGTSWVVGHQEDYRYRLSGVIPSESAKEAITKAVTESYGGSSDSVKVELVVDPSLPNASWIDGSANFVRSIPFTLIDGAFAVNDKQTHISGLAQNQDAIDRVVGAAKENGLPIVEPAVTIANLRPPTIVANIRDGKIDLVGTVPSQRLIEEIVGDAKTLYGEGNVEDNLKVDEATFARFALAKFGQNSLGAFFPLGNFTMRLEDGGVNVKVDDGVAFEPGSSQLTPDIQKKLERIPGFISARSNRPVSVVGHADNTGDPQENLILSQERADAVKKFLVEKGAPAENMTAEGKGESPGDSPEQRSGNRRVEIVVGTI